MNSRMAGDRWELTTVALTLIDYIYSKTRNPTVWLRRARPDGVRQLSHSIANSSFYASPSPSSIGRLIRQGLIRFDK